MISIGRADAAMKKFPPTFICGLARNAGISLLRTLAQIDELKKVLEEWFVVIVTNDNTDKTDNILREWSGHSERHHVICLDGLVAAYPERIDRLAVARNAYLQYLRSYWGKHFDYILSMDFDGPNVSIDAPEFVSAVLSVREHWAGLFANQRQAYYDIYALRHKKWCPGDCLEEIAAKKTFPFRVKKRIRAERKYINDRQFHIPSDHGIIEVESAFGGFGIYRANALQNIWYGSRDNTGRLTCEHVIFNRQIVSGGGRLFIVPRMLNDAATEHLRSSSGKSIPKNFFV